MKDLPLWKKIKSNLESDIISILAVVVDHKGSSPGKTGFKMVFDTESGQIGTIGGGIMELNILARARLAIADPHFQPLDLDQIHNTRVPKQKQSGLICAGEQKIVMLKLTGKDLPTITNIIASIDGKTVSTVYYSSQGIDLNSSGELSKSDTNWEYKEFVGTPNRVYIFGAGHVGTAISQILSTLDFYVIMNDDRKALELLEKNSWVDEKHISSYRSLARDVIEDDKSMVVIVTYGFQSDAEVLEEILSKKVGYVGLMGSKTKIKKIFGLMRENNISEAGLSTVHAPIGLQIDNGTASEIAISVVAELIKVKNIKDKN